MFDPGLVTVGPLTAPVTDLLRLVVVPVFAWAAYRDVKTRRVPNRTWYPLAVLGLVLLAVDGLAASAAGGYAWRSFAIATVISLGLVIPLSYITWAVGGFGGADAKALMTLAVLFPAFPEFYLPGFTLPAVVTRVGVFSFTILTDTVLLGIAFPLVLAARNLAGRRFTLLMFVGRPVAVDSLPSVHGRLLETPAGRTRGGLDLDALRMYLRWRGTDLATLRADPETHRDPDSLPAVPNPPTDGSVVPREGDPEVATDGGSTVGTADGAAETPSDRDPWGAEAFVADVGEPYGTTAEDLRAGLDLLTARDRVWVSPGLPFIVPMFAGIVVALTYGDLLFGILRWFGMV